MELKEELSRTFGKIYDDMEEIGVKELQITPNNQITITLMDNSKTSFGTDDEYILNLVNRLKNQISNENTGGK